jgi:hypothetical protein
MDKHEKLDMVMTFVIVTVIAVADVVWYRSMVRDLRELARMRKAA